MSLLQASSLAFRHDSQADWLFRNVSFDIAPGDRVALVGPNGCGKTSLLRIVAGELQPVDGTLVRRSGLRLAYVRQEVSVPAGELLEDFILDADSDLGSLRRQWHALETSLEDEAAALRYADLLTAYEAGGGYRFEARAAGVLEGLGFDARERALEMGQLSSGQRSRAELARLLLSPADLLLIDEPTNHLDIEAREWLEGYLASIESACLLISHDRVFLNRVASRTFELRRGTLTAFGGSYEFYREQRALAERQAWERYEAQQRREAAARRAAEQRDRTARKVARAPVGVRHGHDFYQAKAARLQRTARILRERSTHEPRAVKPYVETAVPVLDFSGVRRSSDTVLRIEGLAKSFDGKPLFDGLSMSLGRGGRCALVGPNGSGKTTLLRIVRGLDQPDRGIVEMGSGVRVGYFSQEGEHMDPALSPLAFCLGVNANEEWVRTILACLKIRADQVRQPIGSMSGGERAKVALAGLLVGGANLLLLDEPTNHLDIETREALEATLAQFPGAILFVSHDRHFVEELGEIVIDLSGWNGCHAKIQSV
jgi:ATP-binding cassette subfamily F protein 3